MIHADNLTVTPYAGLTSDVAKFDQALLAGRLITPMRVTTMSGALTGSPYTIDVVDVPVKAGRPVMLCIASSSFHDTATRVLLFYVNTTLIKTRIFKSNNTNRLMQVYVPTADATVNFSVTGTGTINNTSLTVRQ